MAKGGGGNNDKAIKLQRQGLRDARVNNAAMMKMMKKSAKDQAGQVLPKYEGPAAVPTQTTADLEGVANDIRQRAMRRQGVNATMFAGLM